MNATLPLLLAASFLLPAGEGTAWKGERPFPLAKVKAGMKGYMRTVLQGTTIERFDLDREIKFETYAITRIKGAIIDELRSLDWVPRSVRSRAREIEKANSKLEHQLQRAPSDEEMAGELEMTVRSPTGGKVTSNTLGTGELRTPFTSSAAGTYTVVIAFTGRQVGSADLAISRTN